MTERGAITTRRATAADAGSVASLHSTSWQDAYRGIISDEYLDRGLERDHLDQWTKRLQDASDLELLLLAEREGAPMAFGYVLLDEHPEWGALLDNLHTLPASRGSGVGRRLVAELSAWVAERRPGAPLHLWVFEKNRRARAFYERLGARNVETIVTNLPGGGEAPILRYCWHDVAELARTAQP